MTKRMIIMLIVAGVVFGGVFGFIAFRNHMIAKFMAARGVPTETVATAVAGYDQWQPHQEGVGSLRAVNGADLSTQVAGTVSALHFESGADVKAGTLLVELSAADDIAKLQSLKATAALAQITLDRDLRQLKVQGVSQQTVDSDQQNLKSDLAQVAAQQAAVDYKSIRAPFDGRLGIRQVDLGQYISPGTVLVTIQALDPIFVDFYLPQQSVAQIKVGQAIKAKIDAYPGRDFAGVISAINPKIDSATRNVQIRATIKNPEHLLLPGMYASVTVDTGEPQRLITVPQTAINYTSYGSSVFIVEKKAADSSDNKGKDAQAQPKFSVREVAVTTGATRGDQVSVLSGVKEGETIVIAGLIKLHNGTPIAIDNSILPKSDPNPTPIDQ